VSGLLQWHPGLKSDRQALQTFTCTDSPVKSRRPPFTVEHPCQWEYNVQQYVRQLRPRYAPPMYLLLGFDSLGLAGVSFYEELDGPSDVFIKAMAIHLRLRHKGGGYADEMFEQTFDAITARAIDTSTPTVQVSARVDERNHPSQQMNRRAGLRHRAMVSEGLQNWSRDFVFDIAEGLIPL
jgi:hypothetical protein